MARLLILLIMAAFLPLGCERPGAHKQAPIARRSTAKPSIRFQGEKTSVDLSAPDGSEFTIGNIRIKLIKSLYDLDKPRKLVEIEAIDPAAHNSVILAAKQFIDQKEIERTQKAQGPGVIMTYGYFYDKRGEPILVTEKMAQSLLSIPYNVTYFASLLSALKRLHEIQIVHTDIKPENVMFDAQLNVKFIDFADSMGTSGYESGDDYALGVTMLEWKAQDALKKHRPSICSNLNSEAYTRTFIDFVVSSYELGATTPDKVTREVVDKLPEYLRSLFAGDKADFRLRGFRCRVFHELLLKDIHELEKKETNLRSILKEKYGLYFVWFEFEPIVLGRIHSDLLPDNDPDTKEILKLMGHGSK